MRTWVSFQANFPQFTAPGEFPGHEIATHLANRLHERGLAVSCPDTLEGNSYDFDCTLPEQCMNVMLVHVQNDMREWLIIIRPAEIDPKPVRQGVPVMAGATVAGIINECLQADCRFRNIRWYTAQSWDSDPYDGWTAAP